jgi:hypothetical protein
MGWLNIAASFLRDAMTSNDPEPRTEETQLPADLASLAEAFGRFRSETSQNFEAVAQMLKTQNEHHLRAIQFQRRWNYGLAAGLIVVAILAIVAIVELMHR